MDGTEKRTVAEDRLADEKNETGEVNRKKKEGKDRMEQREARGERGGVGSEGGWGGGSYGEATIHFYTLGSDISHETIAGPNGLPYTHTHTQEYYNISLRAAMALTWTRCLYFIRGNVFSLALSFSYFLSL